MANWSNPLLTSTYTNFLTEVKDRDTDLALQFDGTTSTNIPTNAIRWNSSVNRWQKWNGSTWGELTSTYALTGLTTTSNATIGGTLGSGAFTSTSSVSGTALLPTGNTVPTNGVYLPSANVLGIATSSTARLIIDASGNVGIGTLSPATGLHVGNAAASATSGNLYIAPTAAAGQARLRLFNGSATAEWLLGQKTSTDHDFKLSKLVSGSESDYFTVDTVGNLSLPATGMRLRLGRILDADVNDSNLTLFGGTNDGANIELFGGAHATLANLAVIDASEHRFRTANGATERLRIDSSGNVGIGTSSPAFRLDVNGQIRGTSVSYALLASNGSGSGQTSIGLRREGGATDQKTWEIFTGAGGEFKIRTINDTYTGSEDAIAIDRGSGFGVSSVQFATGGSERARITSAGRLGLGTSSPGTSFDVALPAASATVGNVRVSPSSAGQARYHLYNGGATAEWLFGQKTSTDHDFKLSTSVAGSESDRLTVTTGGLLKFDSGYGSAATAYGCRAWVNFDGTGTTGTNQTIRASGNVSSVYKNGSGDYTITFTTAMPDANYAVSATLEQAGRDNLISVSDLTTTTVKVYSTDITQGLENSPCICVTITR